MSETARLMHLTKDETGDFMRSWKIFAVCISAGLFAAPATARFGWCMAAIPGKDHQEIPGHYNTTYPSFVSAIIDFGDDTERVAEQFAKQFSAAVGTKYATCYNTREDASGAKYYRGETLKKGLGQHVESAWTGGSPAAANARADKKPDTPVGGIYITGGEPSPARGATARSGPVAPKYVEVRGADGSITRLSAEVAERNKAAAEDYRRKMEAHARDKAVHEQKMAESQESRAKAEKALQDHAAQLRTQQDNYQKQLRDHATRVQAGASDTPCARFRAAKGAGWKVNPCV